MFKGCYSVIRGILETYKRGVGRMLEGYGKVLVGN
jgi:hypothetical protein